MNGADESTSWVCYPPHDTAGRFAMRLRPQNLQSGGNAETPSSRETTPVGITSAEGAIMQLRPRVMSLRSRQASEFSSERPTEARDLVQTSNFVLDDTATDSSDEFVPSTIDSAEEDTETEHTEREDSDAEQPAENTNIHDAEEQPHADGTGTTRPISPFKQWSLPISQNVFPEVYSREYVDVISMMEDQGAQILEETGITNIMEILLPSLDTQMEDHDNSESNSADGSERPDLPDLPSYTDWFNRPIKLSRLTLSKLCRKQQMKLKASQRVIFSERETLSTTEKLLRTDEDSDSQHLVMDLESDRNSDVDMEAEIRAEMKAAALDAVAEANESQHDAAVAPDAATSETSFMEYMERDLTVDFHD